MEKVRARSRKNSKKRDEVRRLKKFGIDADWYSRQLSIQNNACAICKRKTNGKRKFCIDHDHVDGRVRGLLCGKCNLLIGYSNDDVSILEASISYLKMKKGR
jgi:hypothetical protein